MFGKCAQDQRVDRAVCCQYSRYIFWGQPTKEIIKAIKFKGKGSIKPPEDSLVLLVLSIKSSFGVSMNVDMIANDT